MSERAFPPPGELRRRAEARVESLRRVAQGNTWLMALEVSGIQRFIFNVPTDKAGLEVKARSFLVAILPKVLAWRARCAADLRPEHEVMVAAGRAFLLVPEHARERAWKALREGARALREQTGDDLAVDLAEHALSSGSFEEGLNNAFGEVIHGLSRSKLRRAEGEPESFWEPLLPEPKPAPNEESPFATLGRMLRDTQHSIAAVGVTEQAAPVEGVETWPHLLDLTFVPGASVGAVTPALGSPHLILLTDGGTNVGTGDPARGHEIASLPLAGTWILSAETGAGSLDFDGLAERSVGDPKLGVMRLDLDSLGNAFKDATTNKRSADALRDRLALSEAVSFACGPAADDATRSRNVQWILAGGDDLFLVGAWSDVIGAAVALRKAIVPKLCEVVNALAGSDTTSKLDISGGIVIAQPGVPLAHLADMAEAQVHVAKGKRTGQDGRTMQKAAMALNNIAVGWRDWELAVELGVELGDSIARGDVSRGVLRRLVGIHALWRRATDAHGVHDAADASKRKWLWAYELSRSEQGATERGAPLVRRLGKLALDNRDERSARGTDQEVAEWLGIVAEIAHRRTRGRGEERR